MNISGVVARSDSSYKGLNCSSSCRFLLFLKDRNASELVVSLFRDFRFSGQIALRDGILFDEVQIMARNAVFDFERRTDWVVIGCRLKYNLILLNVKTMAVAEAEQDYNPEDQETGDPVEVSADLCEFLQGEMDHQNILFLISSSWISSDCLMCYALQDRGLTLILTRLFCNG